MLKTILHQSLPLSYKVEGKGLPVMLLHGFAEDSIVWDGQVTDLRARYQLIIPDLPGSGPSAPLPGATTLEELADLIKAILVAEGVEQTVLIGHSMGGYITLAFAEKYPDRLKAFGLFHSTAYADSDEKKSGRQKSIEFIRRNGAAAYIRQSTPNLFADSTRKQQPELMASLIDRYAGFNPEVLAAYQQAMILRPDRTPVLQQSTVPVLFIFGQQDALLPLDASLRQSHMPRLAHIHLLENSGHMGMLEDSGRSNRILDDFLQSLPF
ncbi:MAG TPA: alpha/beta fold hydrolase [Puia sp.]|nr:alpha/beta fold hydrolase [Puia sp.]